MNLEESLTYSDVLIKPKFSMLRSRKEATLDIFKNVLEKIIFFVDSSFVSIQLENFCIVSKYPSFISRNSENELHNLSGYAISFDDGYGQHYINGRFLNAEIFQQIIS